MYVTISLIALAAPRKSTKTLTLNLHYANVAAVTLFLQDMPPLMHSIHHNRKGCRKGGKSKLIDNSIRSTTNSPNVWKVSSTSWKGCELASSSSKKTFPLSYLMRTTSS